MQRYLHSYKIFYQTVPILKLVNQLCIFLPLLAGRPCVDVCAFVYICLICCLMIYDFVAYMEAYWGIREDLLHLVSYFTFLFQVMVIPFWCLYARVMYYVISARRRQTYPLYQEYLTRRIAALGSSRYGAHGHSYFRFICFLIWPVVNGILRVVYDYVFRRCPDWSIHEELSHWNAFFGYVLRFLLLLDLHCATFF